MRKIYLFISIVLFNASIVCGYGQVVTAPVGTGTASDPYQIASLENLYWISTQVSAGTNLFNGKYFIQTSDIDATETSTWFSGAGWKPIGTATNYFQGNYNGLNHTISNLYIKRTTSSDMWVGLFGEISGANGMIIQNVRLDNVNIAGYQNVGALAGGVYRSSCIIQNCSSSGSVKSQATGGGLIGYAVGPTINCCFSSCNVAYDSNIGTSGAYFGGLIGCISSDISSSKSYINNSYATGTVSGRLKVGGLVGKATTSTFTGYNNTYVNISNSYSTGLVTATGTAPNYPGGFVGYTENGGATINNCFSDAQTSGQANGIGGVASGCTNAGNGVIARTTADMKIQANYTNWDFVGETVNGINDFWEINAGKNNGYPFYRNYPVAIEATLISPNGFTANWISSPGAVSYQLDVATDNLFSDIVFTNANISTSATSFAVTGLSVNTGYYFRLKATNGTWVSEYSNIKQITTSSTLDAPQVTEATLISRSGFTANWISSPGAVSYQLDVATDNLFSNIVFTDANISPSNTSYAITGLSANTAYYFRLKSVNGTLVSEYSNIKQVNVLALSKKYYVSINGNDAGSGALGDEFKTIQKAATVMNAGDTCFIKQGIYRETVKPLNNGQAGYNMVFTNYNNEKVLVIGTNQVSGWSSYKDGIYKAYCPDSVYQVCVNKKMAVKARYPNSISTNMLQKTDWANVTTTPNQSTVTFSGANFTTDYWKGGICLALTGSAWVAHNGIIQSSTSNTVTCTNRSYPWTDPTRQTSYYIGSGKGFITNHLHALDAVNEWHYQNDTLYYKPGTDLNTSTVEAQTRLLGFDCSGKQYISINNINFVWNTVSFENSEYCSLNGGSVWFGTPYVFFSASWDRSGPSNYGISGWCGKGVRMSGHNNSIRNCYITKSWGDGISVGGNHNTVDNCLVEDCDWIATDYAAVATVGVSHVVKNSTLRSTGRSTLLCRVSPQISVNSNIISDGGYLCEDLGLLYSFASNGNGANIDHNWVHDNHCSNTRDGIYLDNWDTAFVVHHNVIWNTLTAIRTNTPSVNNQIYNNTAWNCTNAMGAWGNTGTIENQIVKNNLSNVAWNQYTTASNNLVTASPNFANASANDYTLQSNSPAIDYGTPIPGITDGFAGSAPDAGAYEYGITPWIPGTTTVANSITEVYDPNYIVTGERRTLESTNTCNVYPNPTTGKGYLSSKNSSIIDVYDVFGRKINARIHGNEIDLGGYPSGLYFLSIKDNVSNQTIVKSIVLASK